MTTQSAVNFGGVFAFGPPDPSKLLANPREIAYTM